MIDDSALLPEVGPLGNASDFEGQPSSDQISVYVVRAGDTLSEISAMFDVSVNTIIWANNLKRATDLKEGQTLVILPMTGIRYTVVNGDTLKSVAKEHHGDIEEIISFNDLDPALPLTVGSIIMIPNGELTILAENEAIPRPKSPRSRRVVGNNGPNYVGYYERPLKGGVRTQGLHGYNGVDLADKSGTPIYAAAGGRVIISKNTGWNGGYGNYVVIKHDNNTQTLYAHNLKNLVTVGQMVEAGQEIAKLGSSGNSTGPHVHFEIRGAKNPF